jgi:hypothetical protein
MNIIKRVKAPTPKFFKVLRNIGLALAALGGTLLAAPVALPVVVTTVGGYLAVAGGLVSAVSQLVTPDEEGIDPTRKSENKEGVRRAQPDTTTDDNGIKGKEKTLSPRKRSGLKRGLRPLDKLETGLAQLDNGSDDVG